MLTIKQIEFCKRVADSKSASEAYRQAFKSTSASTCKVNGSKLLKRADIKAKIKEFQKVNKRIVDKAVDKAAENLATGEIADKVERMKELTRIMRGQTKIRNDKFFYDGKTGEVISQEVEEFPTHQARIAAIKELNEMDGGHAPDKHEHAIASKLPSWLKTK